MAVLVVPVTAELLLKALRSQRAGQTQRVADSAAGVQERRCLPSRALCFSPLVQFVPTLLFSVSLL